MIFGLDVGSLQGGPIGAIFMPKKSYYDYLKDPRWQKKRLKILERDQWTCTVCSNKEGTLHAHHNYYIKDKKPWEYQDYIIETLCEDCHKIFHEQESTNRARYITELYKKITSDEQHLYLREYIKAMSIIDCPIDQMFVDIFEMAMYYSVSYDEYDLFFSYCMEKEYWNNDINIKSFLKVARLFNISKYGFINEIIEKSKEEK